MPNLTNALKAKTVVLSSLLFDPHNPRLLDINEDEPNCPEHKFADKRIQDRLEDKLDEEEFDVRSLADSIRKIGFLRTDRIIVRPWNTPTPSDKKMFVVLEGNRRTRALKKIVAEHENGQNVVSDELIAEINQVEVLVLEKGELSEDDYLLHQRILQGVRHLSGIKAWGPYQQARLIHQLRSQGQSASDAAEGLGISTQAANALWRSYVALEAMKAHEEYTDSVNSNMFSYFHEALRSRDVREWLDWSDHEKKFINASNLLTFYSLITPKENGETPKLPMAIDVRKLGRLIMKKDALAYFLSEEGTLVRALQKIEEESFEQNFEPDVKHCIETIERLPHSIVKSLSDSHKQLLETLSKKALEVLNANKALNK
jgi:hypothetical protein